MITAETMLCPRKASTTVMTISLFSVICASSTCLVSSLSADYLSSLSRQTSDTTHPSQSGTNAVTGSPNDHLRNDDIPDDHYSKNHPMAGWRGYANSQWGGYLDSLPSNRLEEGKKSDYGNDIRWGAEVYLNSVEER